MKKLLLALLLLIGTAGFSHKFYISIADMEYDTTRKSINVSLTMTAHDFEMVLNRKFGEELHLERVSDTSAVGKFIQQYLSMNFQIFNEDQQLEMNYLGKEVTNRDELNFYFFFPDIINPSTIKIVNKLLFSVSDQQQNIVHYKCLGRTKSVTLIPSKYEEWITFNENEDD